MKASASEKFQKFQQVEHLPVVPVHLGHLPAGYFKVAMTRVDQAPVLIEDQSNPEVKMYTEFN